MSVEKYTCASVFLPFVRERSAYVSLSELHHPLLFFLLSPLRREEDVVQDGVGGVAL